MLYEQNLWHSQWETSFFDTNLSWDDGWKISNNNGFSELICLSLMDNCKYNLLLKKRESFSKFAINSVNNIGS